MNQMIDHYTAAHEAGHAVMSLLVNRGVDYVTIEQSKGSPAHCIYGNGIDKDGDEQEVLEKECLCSYAGMVAEKVIFNLEKTSDMLRIYSYSHSDRMNAMAAVQLYYGIDEENEEEDYFKNIVSEYLQRIESKAEVVLSSPRVKQQLIAVTDALMKHRRMTGEQIKTVMGQAG